MRRVAPCPRLLSNIIFRAFAIAVVLSVLHQCASHPANAAEPPMLLIVEQDTVVYGPAGERIAIPSGTELDMCADELGMLMHYELEPMVLRVPAPCAERPLFADGFEEPGR